MKKILLFAVFAFSCLFMHAQDFKKVQTSILLTKFEDAKVEIDKIMADPKSLAKAETWFWKSRIYGALAKNASLSTKYPNIVMDADAAFKKYSELDPTYALVKTNGAEGFFDMYSLNYTGGIKVFNDKKWDEAGKQFESAIFYIDIIIKNKWTTGNLAYDTTSILYAGYSYQNAANEPKLDSLGKIAKLDKAANFYRVLADSKVKDASYVDIYKFLATHYTVTKREPEFKKYITLGRELYPNEPWDEYEIDFMDKNFNLVEKTAMYDKEDAAGTLSEMKYLQFGDLFINTKTHDHTLDSAQLKMYTLKAADAYKKACAKNSQNGIAAFNVGVIYYNIYGDYDDLYAGNIKSMQRLNADKPVEKDPKKKVAADAKFNATIDTYKKANTNLEKPLLENLDMSADWLEKAYAVLKANTKRSKTENSVINKTVDFLANIYAYKRDKARGKDPKALDMYDAKYKEFDALHAKF